jgi:hypothetical protein
MTGGPTPGQFQEQDDKKELEQIIKEQGGFPSQNEDDNGNDLEDGSAASKLGGGIGTGL